MTLLCYVLGQQVQYIRSTQKNHDMVCCVNTCTASSAHSAANVKTIQVIKHLTKFIQPLLCIILNTANCTSSLISEHLGCRLKPEYVPFQAQLSLSSSICQCASAVLCSDLSSSDCLLPSNFSSIFRFLCCSRTHCRQSLKFFMLSPQKSSSNLLNDNDLWEEILSKKSASR